MAVSKNTENNSSKMYKVKMNTNTLLILDKDRFKVDPRLLSNKDMLGAGEVSNYHPQPLTPEADTYMSVVYGQIVEIPEHVYLEYKDRKCFVTNQKMGDLEGEYNERLKNASEHEKKYLIENKEELTTALFHRPFFELVV